MCVCVCVCPNSKLERSTGVAGVVGSIEGMRVRSVAEGGARHGARTVVMMRAAVARAAGDPRPLDKFALVVLLFKSLYVRGAPRRVDLGASTYTWV